MNSSDDLSRFKFLLDGFLNDTLSEADARTFWESIGRSECDEFLLHKVEEEYLHSSELLKKYKYVIGNDYQTVERDRKKITLSSGPIKKLMIAACSFILLSYPVYFLLLEKRVPDIHIGARTLAGYFNVASSDSIVNNKKNPIEVRLPDSSAIVLMPNAEILFPKDFVHNRKIHLRGMAYFKVIHDEKHPFQVYKGGVCIEDVGTAFWITDNAEHSGVAVSVTEGSVLLIKNPAEEIVDSYSKSIQKIEIRMNQRGSFAENGDLCVSIVEAPEIINKNIRFAYDHAPLGQVLSNISNAYGLQVFSEPNSLGKELLFTGDLSRLTFNDKIRVIAKTTGCIVKTIDANIVFTKK